MCFEKKNTGKYVFSSETHYECGNSIHQRLHQRQRELLTDSLFMVVSPLSWDVESDMELVLSDMTVSSAR